MREPRPSNCKDLTTEDNGTTIIDGMRLYNYYDCKWGTVKFSKFTHEDGWFDFIHEDGTKTTLNGVRVSTREI
jgi:hypothetical protein